MLDAIRLDHLGWLPQVALAAALATWAVAFAGLLHHLARPRRHTVDSPAS